MDGEWRNFIEDLIADIMIDKYEMKVAEELSQ